MTVVFLAVAASFLFFASHSSLGICPGAKGLYLCPLNCVCPADDRFTAYFAGVCLSLGFLSAPPLCGPWLSLDINLQGNGLGWS